MKARPLDENFKECKPKDARYVEIRIPSGLCERRVLPIQIGSTRHDTPNWSWNGDTEKPTIKPSILTTNDNYFDGEKFVKFRCHSFVNDGIVEFLNDCTHEFAGKKVSLTNIS